MEEKKAANKRKKGIETQDRILQVSAELIAQRGFDSVTTREIAAGAGIRESSLYNHYDSKAIILDALYEQYAHNASNAWPALEETMSLLDWMKPEDVMKGILFQLSKKIDITLANTTRIIFTERFRNAKAAELYDQMLVEKPVAYYTLLFNRMKEKNLIGRDIDTKAFAEHFNYVSVALTMEQFMAVNGFGSLEGAVQKILSNVNFYIDLMKNK